MRALWITFVIVFVDQLTKTIVALNLEVGRSVHVIGDLLKWTYTKNPGMAFGFQLGDGDIGKLILTVFSVVATGLIFAYVRHVRDAPFGYRASLALILGGALGNVIDRVFYGAIYGECLPPYSARLLHGCVVDFFHIDIGTLRIGDRALQVFPIGNIADLAIIAGVVGVLLSQGAFKEYVERTTAPPPESASASPEVVTDAASEPVPPPSA